jgi:hypothetical protein
MAHDGSLRGHRRVRHGQVGGARLNPPRRTRIPRRRRARKLPVPPPGKIASGAVNGPLAPAVVNEHRRGIGDHGAGQISKGHAEYWFYPPARYQNHCSTRSQVTRRISITVGGREVLAAGPSAASMQRREPSGQRTASRSLHLAAKRVYRGPSSRKIPGFLHPIGHSSSVLKSTRQIRKSGPDGRIIGIATSPIAYGHSQRRFTK